MVATDLARVLKDSLDASHDSLGFTAATVVNEIIKRLHKAYSRLNRHSRRHNNLFIAFFDQQALGGAK